MNYTDFTEYSEEYYLPKELDTLHQEVCKEIWEAAKLQWKELKGEAAGTFLGKIEARIGKSKLLRGTYHIIPVRQGYDVRFVFYDASGREISERIHTNDNPTSCMALCHEDALKRLARMYKGECHFRPDTLVQKTRDIYKDRIINDHTFL